MNWEEETRKLAKQRKFLQDRLIKLDEWLRNKRDSEYFTTIGDVEYEINRIREDYTKEFKED